MIQYGNNADFFFIWVLRKLRDPYPTLSFGADLNIYIIKYRNKIINALS